MVAQMLGLIISDIFDALCMVFFVECQRHEELRESTAVS